MAQNVKCPRCGRSTPDATYCQYCGKALHACSACGARISRNAIFCSECGAPISKEQRDVIAIEHTSWAWWLVPLLLGFLGFAWVGGLIAWSLIRYKDPSKATNLLWFGISLTIIEIVAVILIRVTQH